MLKPKKPRIPLKDKVKVATTLIKKAITPIPKSERINNKKVRKDYKDYENSLKEEFPEYKKGGSSDKKWMQKVSASIKKRGTEGKCTPITKPGCTGKARALAMTFKKIAKANKKK